VKLLAVILEFIACVLLFQAAFRWPGYLDGALEAFAVILLPILLTRAMYKGRSWWVVWLSLFVGVMLLTIWMPPTIAAKGGIPTGLSWFAGVLLWAYDSLPPALALLLARFIWKNVPGWRGATAAACGAALVMVACDTWLLHVYPWTWAAALASPPLLGRAAAFLGTEGFTAIIWIHGVLAGCFLISGTIKRAVISLVSMLALLLTLSGVWHLLPRERELALDIAIIQPNYPVNTYIPNQLADMWSRSDALLAENGLPGQDRPTLLLWSESSVTNGNYLLPDPDLTEMAKDRNVSWLFGTDGWLDMDSPQNLVRGETAGQKPFFQVKVIPMPFGERMPGPAWIRKWLEDIVGFKSWMSGELNPDSSFCIPVQTGEAIKVHPLICSEVLVPRRVRKGLRIAGGDILTEHTNDAWFETSIAADLHASMARLRALESGTPIVRATLSGRSGLVREDGTWRHISDVMSEGAWSFELKWQPIRTPARTEWPFYSLLFLLIGVTGLFAWPVIVIQPEKLLSASKSRLRTVRDLTSSKLSGYKREKLLTAKPLILASASPRRKYWFDAVRIPFEVVVPIIDEVPLADENPAEMVVRLAREKALSVSIGSPGRWVLAADTTVVVDQGILGKPKDTDDAVNMLLLIQGRKHCVHTGVCLVRDGEIHEFVDTAEVHIRPLTLEQIHWYVATGEPMDKAGAYAAQGIAALFIEHINGSFATVMGLPIERLGGLFFELGLLDGWLWPKNVSSSPKPSAE